MKYPPSARPFVEENLTLKHRIELAEKENARLKAIIKKLNNGETLSALEWFFLQDN